MPTYMPTAAPTANWISTPVTASYPTLHYSAVAVSNDGSCISLGTANGKGIFSRQSLSGTFTQYSPSYTSSTANITSISMSLDGVYQVACNMGTSTVLVSDSSGVNWNSFQSSSLNINGQGWKYSSMSNNGYVLLLSQAKSTFAVYVGNPQSQWSPTFTIHYINSGATSIIGVAMDSTGKTFATMDSSNYLYLSYNYGSTWSQSQYPVVYNTQFTGFAMSRSPSNPRMMVVYGSNQNLILLSNNRGKDWYGPQFLPGAPTNIWNYVAVSSTGQYMVGSVQSGIYDPSTSQEGVYISSDYGQTWTMVYPSVGGALPMIDQAGNYLAFVQGGISASPDLYYYEQAGWWMKCDGITLLICVFSQFQR